MVLVLKLLSSAVCRADSFRAKREVSDVVGLPVGMWLFAAHARGPHASQALTYMCMCMTCDK